MTESYNVIDVSFDGYADATNKDTVEDIGATAATISSSSVTISAMAEIDTSAMNRAKTTLPAIVIGFASTIVFCGLFFIVSEFRERREFKKMMMKEAAVSSTMMIELSSDTNASNDGVVSTRCDHSQSSRPFQLVEWDGKQFRVVSVESDSSSPCTNESYGSRLGFHQTSYYNDNESKISGNNSQKHVAGATAADRIYDSSIDQSSLYYDVHKEYHHPTDNNVAGENIDDNKQEYNDVAPIHRHGRRTGDYFFNHQIITNYDDDESLSAISSLTTSLRLRNISDNVTELSDGCRVSDEVPIENFINLSHIPATKVVPSSSSSLSRLEELQQQIGCPAAFSDKQKQVVSSDTGSNQEIIDLKKSYSNEQEYAKEATKEQVSIDHNEDRKVFTLSLFDGGTVAIPEVMPDDFEEGEDQIDVADHCTKINHCELNNSNCLISEEENELILPCTIGMDNTHSENNDKVNSKSNNSDDDDGDNGDDDGNECSSIVSATGVAYLFSEPIPKIGVEGNLVCAEENKEDVKYEIELENQDEEEEDDQQHHQSQQDVKYVSTSTDKEEEEEREDFDALTSTYEGNLVCAEENKEDVKYEIELENQDEEEEDDQQHHQSQQDVKYVSTSTDKEEEEEREDFDALTSTYCDASRDTEFGLASSADPTTITVSSEIDDDADSEIARRQDSSSFDKNADISSDNHVDGDDDGDGADVNTDTMIHESSTDSESSYCYDVSVKSISSTTTATRAITSLSTIQTNE